MGINIRKTACHVQNKLPRKTSNQRKIQEHIPKNYYMDTSVPLFARAAVKVTKWCRAAVNWLKKGLD